MKKVPKEDPVAKILANSDDTENQIESDTEKSEHEEYITEEQYLKEQNLLLKEQMLQDSSESEHLDSDSDEQLNGGFLYGMEYDFKKIQHFLTLFISI